MTAPAPINDDEDSKLAVQLTIIILVATLMLNVLFYFLSGFYYDDKRATEGLMSTITDATVSRTRLSFGIFSGLTAATLCGAMFAPKWVGHGVSALFGIASIIGAVFAASAGISNALTVSLVLIGLLYPALAVLSLLRQSRAAWSFLCSVCWVRLLYSCWPTLSSLM